MEQEFRQLVEAVAARMRRPAVWRFSAIGLLAGGALGILLAVVAWLGNWTILAWIAIATVVAVPLACAAFATTRKVEPLRAVRAIDTHYRLKSRAMTLWSFLHAGRFDEARQLAVNEAWSHVRQAEPTQVVSVSVPKTVYLGGGLSALAVVLAVLPMVLSLMPASQSAGVSQAQDTPQLASDGAELTDLAPLPDVDSALIQKSLNAVSPGDQKTGTSQLPNPSAGTSQIVNHYFDATAAPR